MDMQEETPIFVQVLDSIAGVSVEPEDNSYNTICIDVDGDSEDIDRIRDVIQDREEWSLENCLSSEGEVYDLRCSKL